MGDPCLPALRSASYRGAPFWVEHDTEDYARRIVTHEKPMSETPDFEDLGARYESFRVTGYVFGSDAVAQKDAVAAAAKARGPAILTLPAVAPFMARCMSLSISRSKDRQGYFELAFEFRKDDGGSMGFFTPLGAFESMIGSVLTDAIAPISDMVSEALQVVDVALYARDAAVGVVQGLASAVFDAVGTVADAVAPAFADITAFVSDVGAVSGAALNVYSNAETLLASSTSDASATATSGVVPAIFDLMNSAVATMTPADAYTVTKTLTDFSVNEEPPIDPNPNGDIARLNAEIAKSSSEQARAKNVAVLNAAVRSAALILNAKAASAMTYDNRAQAVQTRADLVEAFSNQITQTDDIAVVKALCQARDLAVKAISAQTADLAPVIDVTAPQSMPALYWAYRLYGDPSRADELVARNDVTRPAFMPSRFEALSR